MQHEIAERQSLRLAQRLRWAKLPQQASIEDVDTRQARGLARGVLAQLIELAWVDQHLNLLITGPTGVGKSYIASALAMQACRQDRSVRYFRLPRLAEQFIAAGAQHKKSALFKSLARIDLLVLDDFGLVPMSDEFRRDLLELIDDRFDKTSTLITSQLPISEWHRAINDPTLADAILERLVHNAHRLELQGESMRKKKAASQTNLSDDRRLIVEPTNRPFSVPTSNRNRLPTSVGLLYRHRRNTHSCPRLTICSAATGSDSFDRLEVVAQSAALVTTATECPRAARMRCASAEGERPNVKPIGLLRPTTNFRLTILQRCGYLHCPSGVVHRRITMVTTKSLFALCTLTAALALGGPAHAAVVNGLTFSSASDGANNSVGTHLHSSTDNFFPIPAGKAEVGRFFNEEVRGLSEFNLSGQSPTSSALLSFAVFVAGGLFTGANDFPFAGSISIFSYAGNNAENVPDYQASATGTVSSFSTTGLLVGQTLSFNVTSLFNAALSAGAPALGVRLQSLPLNASGAWTFDTFRLTVTEVPEPSAVALLLLGLGSMAFLLRATNRK